MTIPSSLPDERADPGPESAPSPSPRLLIAVAMLAVGVAQGFGRFTYALLLPAIDRDMLHSYSLAGLLATANVAAYLAGTLAVSVASSRLEPARLMRIGLVAATLGLGLLSVAAGMPSLLAGMVLTGLAGAFIWVPSPGLAGSVVADDRRGLAIGLLGAGIGISIVVAGQVASVVRAIAGEDSWRPVWAVEAAVAAVALAAALRWLRRAPGGDEEQGRVRLSALRAVPGWLGVVGAYAAYGLGYSLYVNYLVAALEEDAGFTVAHATAVYSLIGVAIVFGGVLLGRISDRVGRRAALVWGYVVMAACPLLVLAGSEPWASLSAFFFGLMLSGLGSVVAAHLADHLPPRAFAAAFGTVTLFFGIAQVIGPQLGGWIAETTGSFSIAFGISSAAWLVGAASAATMPRTR
ncbi:MAG: hypothetical protein QOD06_2934 [Candidatus Binatota bacterium]|nr:hypothetical protein [Candidatus Binatota bacterium]